MNAMYYLQIAYYVSETVTCAINNMTEHRFKQTDFFAGK